MTHRADGLNDIFENDLTVRKNLIFNNGKINGLVSSRAIYLDSNKNITSVSGSSGFVKADGSLDNSTYTPTSRTLTINGIGYDLSANRSWTVTATSAGNNGQLQYNNSGNFSGANIYFTPGGYGPDKTSFYTPSNSTVDFYHEANTYIYPYHSSETLLITSYSMGEGSPAMVLDCGNMSIGGAYANGFSPIFKVGPYASSSMLTYDSSTNYWGSMTFQVYGSTLKVFVKGETGTEYYADISLTTI